MYTLIPQMENLPAPPALLIILEQAFFLIHILLVNIVLGLSLLMLHKWLKVPKGEYDINLFKPISKKIPILFAFAINMAIPALLFLQVVFGHLFYTSSILIATFWIMIIPLLIIAYYSSYYYYKKIDISSVRISIIALIIAIFLYTGFILVNNLSLMELPQKWQRYFENKEGTILLFDELSMYFRFLHFLVASVAIGGLFYSVYFQYSKDLSPLEKSERVGYGLRIFGYGSIIQALVGVAFLLSLPKSVMLMFLGTNLVATGAMAIAVIFAVLSIIYSFKKRVELTGFFLILTMIFMTINRYHLRLFQLGDNFKFSELKIIPQWDVFFVFLSILIVGLFTVGYMLKLGFGRAKGG